MDKTEMKKKIVNEEDYIKSPKFSNSLNKFLSRTHELIEDSAIARILMMTEKEVEEVYQSAVKKLKELMEESEEE
jgi:hypothetical protein